jgi:thiamine biosynthesis lipoprotein
VTAAAPAVSDWQALGTSASVVTTDPDALGVARAAVESELAAIDLAASRFREDSELSRVNAAAGRWVTVSPLFVEALQAALRAAAITDGTVDPTVGQSLIVAGYDRDFALLESVHREGPPRPRVKALRAPGIDAIALDARHGTVAVARGVRLDLGATAKALAADRSAAAAARAGGCGVLVSLGGDISVAGDPPDGGWRIRVCEDHAAGPEAAGQTISVAGGGLATSSTTTRRWRDADGVRHHIIDPASGSPAVEVWRTASVAAATCVDANAAATAAIVMGEAAVAWLTRAALPARLVAADGSIRRVGEWPTPGDD